MSAEHGNGQSPIPHPEASEEAQSALDEKLPYDELRRSARRILDDVNAHAATIMGPMNDAESTSYIIEGTYNNNWWHVDYMRYKGGELLDIARAETRDAQVREHGFVSLPDPERESYWEFTGITHCYSKRADNGRYIIAQDLVSNDSQRTDDELATLIQEFKKRLH